MDKVAVGIEGHAITSLGYANAQMVRERFANRFQHLFELVGSVPNFGYIAPPAIARPRPFPWAV